MKTDIKKWVDIWCEAGAKLDSIHAEEIRQTDTAAAIRAFEGILLANIARHPPLPFSGLVEQQKLFSKIRHE